MISPFEGFSHGCVEVIDESHNLGAQIIFGEEITTPNYLFGEGSVLRPSKFEGHCPMIRHGCRMALMVALNWSVECVKEES
ncbi:MAG: hypothetical protein BECKG1743E_GA0114224_106973 [Candidatus Kentron sp. G]|nr:MAG: hypothetical protein BECKG1743E_GA0114224_106973 [Candidatus Kentron sp. G]